MARIVEVVEDTKISLDTPAPRNNTMVSGGLGCIALAFDVDAKHSMGNEIQRWVQHAGP